MVPKFLVWVCLEIGYPFHPLENDHVPDWMTIGGLLDIPESIPIHWLNPSLMAKSHLTSFNPIFPRINHLFWCFPMVPLARSSYFKSTPCRSPSPLLLQQICLWDEGLPEPAEQLAGLRERWKNTNWDDAGIMICFYHLWKWYLHLYW